MMASLQIIAEIEEEGNSLRQTHLLVTNLLLVLPNLINLDQTKAISLLSEISYKDNQPQRKGTLFPLDTIP